MAVGRVLRVLVFWVVLLCLCWRTLLWLLLALAPVLSLGSMAVLGNHNHLQMRFWYL
jgi:hypothetical protein